MNTNNIKLAIAIMLCCNSTLMDVHATLCNVNGKTKYLYIMATYDILFVYIYRCHAVKGFRVPIVLIIFTINYFIVAV